MNHASEEISLDASLDQVILGAGAHGFERHPLVVQPRNDDDRLASSLVAGALESGNAGAIWKTKIQQHDIDRGVTESLESRREALDALEVEGLRLDVAQHLEDEARV